MTRTYDEAQEAIYALTRVINRQNDEIDRKDGLIKSMLESREKLIAEVDEVLQLRAEVVRLKAELSAHTATVNQINPFLDKGDA